MKFNKYSLLFILSIGLLLSACGEDDKLEVNTGSVNENEITYESIKLADKEFMEEKAIKLTAKEVQFDMANNLDEDFFMSGILELCDYYNYGYTNEKDFACTKLTQVEGDSWYLYLHRKSLDNFYQALLSDNLPVRVSAIIPSKVYKSNQGNMAMIKSIRTHSYQDSN